MKRKINLESILEKKTVEQYNPSVKKRGGEAVIYTRVSSSEQASNNGSLEVQKKFCDEFCFRNQIHIREYFGGTFESAKSDGRKEFQRMLEFVKKNTSISFIIVFNFDRFSRTGSAAAQLSEDLRTNGVIVRSVTQEIDTSTAMGRLSENMFHMINNFDNRVKSDRTIINTREVMLKGYWPYTTPMGYLNLKKKQRACFHKYIITDVGRELRKAFILKAQGRYTNVEIISRLNARGVKINKTNFQGIISNPFYAGYVTGNLVGGKLIKGKHPALIDLETFLKANDELALAPGAGIPKKSRHEELPLKTFVKDEISGQPLTGYITKGNWYYKVKEAKMPVNISAKKLNDLFIANLTNFEYQKKYKPALKKILLQTLKNKTSNAITESRLIKKKISEKHSQIEKLEVKFVEGDINKELYEKFNSKYQKEVEILEKELTNYDFHSSNFEMVIEKSLEIAQNISSAWVSASFEKKQKLQNLVFPEGLLYNKVKGVVRTPRVNSLFASIEPLVRVLAENKNGDSIKNRQKFSSVPGTGFEPARPFEHHHLKVACLPISTPGQLFQRLQKFFTNS